MLRLAQLVLAVLWNNILYGALNLDVQGPSGSREAVRFPGNLNQISLSRVRPVSS